MIQYISNQGYPLIIICLIVFILKHIPFQVLHYPEWYPGWVAHELIQSNAKKKSPDRRLARMYIL